MPKGEQPKPESLTQLELKANLNPGQREYLEVLKDKMKKIFGNKTKQELAKAGDLTTLKNYKVILTKILDFLRTKQIPNIDKSLWDWEIGSRDLVDMFDLEKDYGVRNLPKPIFTQDGENFFVNVRKKDEIWRLLKNNKDFITHTDGEEVFEEVALSDDGKHVLAVDINFVKGKVGKTIKVDNKDWNLTIDAGEYDYQAQFSPDGTKLAVLGEFSKRGRILVENDHKVDDPAEDLLSYVAFSYSPDGTKKAIVYDTGVNQKVIDGDKKWKKSFKSCTQPVYSPDASKLAVVDDNKKIFINNERLIINFAFMIEIVGIPVFSPDSRKIAFVMKGAQADREFLFEDGGNLWPHTMFKNIFSSSIVYSPNSKNIACVVRNVSDKIVVIVNGTSPANTKCYEAIEQLTFSPDGQKIMFVGLKDGRYSRVVADVSEFVD